MWYWVSLLLCYPSPAISRNDGRTDNHYDRRPGLTTLFPSAALCQVFDSIYMDVPMSRVKFNVNSEYAYIQNYKVLQSTITPFTP